MNLDDKLWKILAQAVMHHLPAGDYPLDERISGEWVAQIRKVFEEAGYTNVEPACNMANHFSGQEWYDRFIKELDECYDSDTSDGYISAEIAAKRASGVSDE